MRIGIDARLFGPRVGGGGIGRYVEQLVNGLQAIDQKNHFVLFLKDDAVLDCKITNQKFEVRRANIHWYTFLEQIRMPRIIDREHLDIVHIPHWNVPLFLKTPFIVTIHDLILLDEPLSTKTSTRNPIIHTIKRLAFRFVLKNAIYKSQHIIAISEFTKSRILKHFPRINPNKISVIYPGVTSLHQSSPPNLPNHTHPILPSICQTYFLYVGNAYPHKNLESLLHAFSFFVKLHPDVHLVLAGRTDVFYERLQKELAEIQIPNSNVHFVMGSTDQELYELYIHASVYLFPSRHEGFGLPPLEAMSLGIPVIASNTTSLPEILGDAALYFSPDDIEEMVQVMETGLTDIPLRAELIEKGHNRTKHFSWNKMSQTIHALYEQTARIPTHQPKA